jgi:hypothetical protein
MKNQVKILISICAILTVMACKKKDHCAPEPEPIATTTTTADTTTTGSVASYTANEDSVTANTTGNSATQRKFFKRRPTAKKLTQYQIDSIKTERGAIVTPAQNVGASLTPGSGMAVPSNTKVGPGTTATMGSSTGD